MRQLLALSAAVALALAGPRPAAAAGPATPSDVCGTGHRDIYRMWRESAHARSFYTEERTFLPEGAAPRDGHAP